MTRTITIDEIAEMWPEVKYMCSECGLEGASGYNPASVTEAQALNFFACECGAEGKKIKIDAFSEKPNSGVISQKPQEAHPAPEAEEASS